MMAKPMKTLKLHYPMIQLLITWNIPQITILYHIIENRVENTVMYKVGRLDVMPSSIQQLYCTLYSWLYFLWHGIDENGS